MKLGMRPSCESVFQMTPADWVSLRGPRSYEDLEIIGTDPRFAPIRGGYFVAGKSDQYGPPTPAACVLQAAKEITYQMAREGNFPRL